MKKYIFDLDYTLYNNRDNIDNSSEINFYKSFRPKFFLYQTLQNLNEKTYIFTNGNTPHANFVLNKMGLKKFFPQKNIITRDDISKIKPHSEGYLLATKKFKLKKTDDIYFFEDTYENLKTAKFFGWKTVLISPIKPPGPVDYYFTNIEDALLFFLVNKKFENMNV